jgi:imidazoleglycerol phosphate synthase glutamine amidotransferase subunit HisH
MGRVITMNDINEEYIDILNEHGLVTSISNHKKHLKKLISENICDVQFVKSHRAYESEQVISTKMLGTTVNDLRENQTEYPEMGFKSVECLSKAAAILRNEIAAMEKWNFTGSMTDFSPPPKLASFLK